MRGQQRPEKGLGSPGSWVTADCVLVVCEHWEPNSELWKTALTFNHKAISLASSLSNNILT